LRSLLGSEGGAYANAKRHRGRCDLISGYPIARCVVVRSKASAPYPLMLKLQEDIKIQKVCFIIL